MVDVNFKIHYITIPGEAVFVIVEHTKELALEWTDGHYWQGHTELEAAKKYEWRYVVRNYRTHKTRREEIIGVREHVFNNKTYVRDWWFYPWLSEYYINEPTKAIEDVEEMRKKAEELMRQVEEERRKLEEEKKKAEEEMKRLDEEKNKIIEEKKRLEVERMELERLKQMIEGKIKPVEKLEKEAKEIIESTRQNQISYRVKDRVDSNIQNTSKIVDLVQDLCLKIQQMSYKQNMLMEEEKKLHQELESANK